MLAVGYKSKENTYHDAIGNWLTAQPYDAVFMFVGFLGVSIGEAPRAYIATPSEIAAHLKQQYLGRGHTALDEDNPTYYRDQNTRISFRRRGVTRPSASIVF